MKIQTPSHSTLSISKLTGALCAGLLSLFALLPAAHAAGVPVAITSSAIEIQGTSAILTATVNPEGSDTTVGFTYDTVTPPVANQSSTVVVPSSSSTTTVTIMVTGLSPNTLYYFQVTASNTTGNSATSRVGSFTTAALPTVDLSAFGADINYEVAPAQTSSGYFQFGTDPTFATNTLTTMSVRLGAANRPVTLFATLTPLAANTTYYYRLVTETNRNGTFYGVTQTFTSLNIQTTQVVARGDSVPVSAKTEYFNLPGTGAIDQNDIVAFYSSMASGPNGSGAAAVPAGIWTFDPSVVSPANPYTLVAGADTTDADTGGKFGTLNNPVINNNDQVAFRAILANAGGGVNGSNNTGVWSTSSGALHVVARASWNAPGTSANSTIGTFDALTSVGISDVNTLVIGTLNTSSTYGISKTNNAGIWEGTKSTIPGGATGDVVLVMQSGGVFSTTTGDSKTISTFAPFPTAVPQQIQTRNFASNTGHLALGATFTDKTTGIITVKGATIDGVAASGDAAPGAGGATFASFNNPIINTGDKVAFQATLATGGSITKSNNMGIWTDGGGSLALVAQTGQASPDASGNLTGPDFVLFTDPVMNSSNAIAFRGITSGPNATNSAIFSNASGTLKRIIGSGDAAPGVTVISSKGVASPGTFQTFTVVGLPDSGHIIFTATLVHIFGEIDYSNDTGIWAADQNGNIQLIARTGDLVNGKFIDTISFIPGSPLVSQLVDGQSRSFSQPVGDMTYLVTFTDNSSAVYEAVFP